MNTETYTNLIVCFMGILVTVNIAWFCYKLGYSNGVYDKEKEKG